MKFKKFGGGDWQFNIGKLQINRMVYFKDYPSLAYFRFFWRGKHLFDFYTHRGR